MYFQDIEVLEISFSCPKLLSLENPSEFIWILKSGFEIWKIESKPEKVLSSLKIYFKHGLCGVVPCACIQVYHVIMFNTHTWHHSAGSMFEKKFQTE